MTDMTEQEERLVAAAIAAMGQAYAPYSKFPVGAAILDEGGGILRTRLSAFDAAEITVPLQALSGDGID